MKIRRLLPVLAAVVAAAQEPRAMEARARRYLIDLIRLDTTNPPGNETRAARYLEQAAQAAQIPCELLGDDPNRLNFVARLRGSGAARPLLLMAHSDVVPADRAQWTADPYGGEVREGYIYGRGAVDTKDLLAAQLAVLVELKRRAVKLRRDVILLSEADEEAGSTGIQWLVQNAWEKIDAEFAINEGGTLVELASGTQVYQIQTSEKIPTRVTLTARGTAGHGSLPLADNPVVRLSRAVARLADADQPVRLNTTTRRYLEQMARLEEYRWLRALAPRLEAETSAIAAAGQIRGREPELDTMLRTSVSPTMLSAGVKINVIPNLAEAQIDVRRLPNETREEVMDRFRKQVNDPAVEILPAPGQEMPATEPSSLATELYLAMERVFRKQSPRATVVPFMQRGATDGAFLRQKGMAVYGVPLFARPVKESRAHGNDERVAIASFEAGTRMLLEIVLAVAAEH